MDGPHDLGGKQGFGPVEYEVDEPTFHERWESRVFGMLQSGALVTAGANGNLDQGRHAIERIRPGAYLTHGYYGRWLGGVENLVVEAGLLTSDEIQARYRELGGHDDDLVAAQPSKHPDRIDYPPADPNAARRLDSKPRFSVGDRVRTLRYGVPGHTRLPAYVRDRVGNVTAWHEGWVYPDTNAHGKGENPQHLYTVAFDAAELWGPDAEAGVRVHIDLFEPYLEVADV